MLPEPVAIQAISASEWVLCAGETHLLCSDSLRGSMLCDEALVEFRNRIIRSNVFALPVNGAVRSVQ